MGSLSSLCPHPTLALHSCLSSCTTITEHLLFARHKARTSDESLKGFVNQGIGAEAQLVQSMLLKREGPEFGCPAPVWW